jgi:hydrogenase maturation factor
MMGSCGRDGEGHCGVCGDEAIRALVLELDVSAGLAVVATDTGTITAALDLIADHVRPGDSLLVHQGFAIAKVSE